MNLAFALNTYNQTKVASETNKPDGYEAVKYALDQVVGSMEKLNTGLDTDEKELHFERALSSIYFLQKCLDFEKTLHFINPSDRQCLCNDFTFNQVKYHDFPCISILLYIARGLG